jgi:hypothetical protein
MQCNLPLVFKLVSKLQVSTFGAWVSVKALSFDLHMARVGGEYHTNQTKALVWKE